MFPPRFLMLTAALLISAAAANAQSTTPSSGGESCPFMGAPTWLTQYLQQSMAAWQQVRGVCMGQATCEDAHGLGCAMCPKAVQAPAACCCAKACTCCETCKAKKDTTARIQVMPFLPTEIWGEDIELRFTGQPMLPPHMQNAEAEKWIESELKKIAVQQADRNLKIAEYYRRTGHPGAAYFYEQLLPTAPPMPLPPPRQIVQVQTIPAPPMLSPAGSSVRVVECVPAAPAKHAHLVTPDLEAHCVRMTHRGDMIVLEGDVLLLSKKHAQPIRIEAQRVIVNMKDGTFTVESNVRPSVSSFGATRTSAIAPVSYFLNEGNYSVCPSSLTPLPPVPVVAPAAECSAVKERRFQAIRLRNTQAVDVAYAINDLVSKCNPDCTALPRDATASAEPISNSVLLSATPKCFDLLVRIIGELDAPKAQPIATPPIPTFGR